MHECTECNDANIDMDVDIDVLDLDDDVDVGVGVDADVSQKSVHSILAPTVRSETPALVITKIMQILGYVHQYLEQGCKKKR